ncbi:NADP-dependent malic enzyme [Porphyromonas cangingivalis]|uniref:Malate dehydrogenase (Oxaloacetate-decarboxylating)(NADP+) n=1 Tax=Porphyromonas cangingivalis TaxID=36874 RepID=A0A1T4NG07_PORCN|nr:NADP-dependent malic enzyme [Porphyromonas cangingivalis]SJZ78154.1 malate dehydrogenase (oxaloacetate-decarboxylating)(NADP+) [Porphyromonas cangingivalis]VEJ02256.1 NADP-dependent malic enzyme [Porphyromonas cangingivalis]
MDNKLKEMARAYHAGAKPGKIEVKPTKPYSTQQDLTLAYSPGVAVPCKDIEADPSAAYDYTAKGNLVAVISNGTAVLGLGDIGAMAGKPVMEGKGLLFKIYAGIDVFDIEVDEKDPQKFIDTVKAIAPTFGGINLEDIKAPECFEIEERLKAELDIPVMHDDQHGTAIISSAGLLNALILAGKKIEDARIVVNGAGASAFSCTKLYESCGAKRENIVMIDSKGVITSDRADLTEQKRYFATERRDVRTLAEAIVGADVFVGLSRPGVLTQDMIRSMADNPIVFALANPDPEITYEEAMSARKDIIMATGRSDYPNQINNVIGFPYIFRGALDVRAKAINEEMKMAATMAIAALARESVPDEVNTAYGNTTFKFGRDYFIPKPVDPRLIVRVSTAVAKAAIESGVAQKTIEDWEAYEDELLSRLGLMSHLTRRLHEAAKLSSHKIVYAAGENVSTLKAAVEVRNQKLAEPIILGNPNKIKALAAELDLSLEGIEIVNHRSDEEKARRQEYSKQLAKNNWRKGGNVPEAMDQMFDPNYFGMMMVASGDADGMVTGVYSHHSHLANIAKQTVGLEDGVDHFATMHMVTLKNGPLFLADTLINCNLTAEALVDITVMAADKVRCFGVKPVVALVGFSDFGSDDAESTREARKAVAILHEKYPHIMVEGEMRVSMALHADKRDARYPENKIKGHNANVLIFPRLSAANACYQLLREADDAEEVVGPIQMGLRKPVYFTDHDATVTDIVNITAMAVHDCSTCLV